MTTKIAGKIKITNGKTILIGAFVNAKSCAKVACELATEHIEIVMGGFNRTFAIEDFLAAGEIIYWIKEELEKENKSLKENINKIKEYLFPDLIFNSKISFDEKMVKDLGETSTKFQSWWDRMAQKYQWESAENGNWEINFETCEIYLVTPEN